MNHYICMFTVRWEFFTLRLLGSNLHSARLICLAVNDFDREARGRLFYYCLGNFYLCRSFKFKNASCRKIIKKIAAFT